MLASFLIFFREAFEASMICSILLAFLKQIGRQDRFKDVWFGIGSAIVVAVASGVVVYNSLKEYDGTPLQSKIEGITYFLACGVLTYMTFWMKRQSKNIKAELHAKLSKAVGTSSMLAIAFIAFLSVGRESLETVVFMIAIAFHTSALFMGIGAVIGLMAGLMLSYVIYILGKRVNLKHFFDVMGTLLMLFAAGLLVDGIQAFQELNWMPSTKVLWSTASVLNQDTTFGDILHSFFGYVDNPNFLQVAAYTMYLLVVLALFLKKVPRKAGTGVGA